MLDLVAIKLITQADNYTNLKIRGNKILAEKKPPAIKQQVAIREGI